MNNLSINSHNINGLNKKHKLQTYINKIIHDNKHIILLQETRINISFIIDNIHKTLSIHYHVFISKANNNARGGMMTNFNKQKFTDKDITLIDNTHKLQIFSLLINNINYKIYNIHSPNTQKEKNNYFNTINEIFINPHDNNILIGDFNTIINTQLDRHNSRMKGIGMAQSKALIKLMDENLLLDTYRHNNANGKIYTYYKSGYFARLDLIITSHKIANKIQNYTVNYTYNSDHYEQNFKFNTNNNTTINTQLIDKKH